MIIIIVQNEEVINEMKEKMSTLKEEFTDKENILNQLLEGKKKLNCQLCHNLTKWLIWFNMACNFFKKPVLYPWRVFGQIFE